MNGLFLAVLIPLVITANAQTNTTNNWISSHVLDISSGLPAAGIAISAYVYDEQNRWVVVGSSITDQSGRVSNVHVGHPLKEGRYMLHFDTAPYFSTRGQDTFYPYIEVVFEVGNSAQHYHVPITLSNYGYSTYRGQ